MRRTKAVCFTVLAVLVVTGASMLGFATPAAAHAAFEGSTPARDEVVGALPERVVLRFAKKQATLTGDPVRVYDTSGARIDLGDARLESGDAIVSIGLRTRPSAAGRFHVHFQLVSADTHVVTDHLSFTVDPSGGPAATSPPPDSVPGRGVVGSASSPFGALERGASGGAISSSLQLRSTGTVVGSGVGGLLAAVALVLVLRALARARRPETALSGVRRDPPAPAASRRPTPTPAGTRPRRPTPRRASGSAPLGQGVRVLASSAGRGESASRAPSAHHSAVDHRRARSDGSTYRPETASSIRRSA